MEMSEQQIKAMIIMNIIDNCTMELDNTGQERYSLNEKQFGKCVDTLVKNINAIQCCTKLKDKEEPTFEEWVYMNNYTPKARQYFDVNSIMWTEHELINMYNNEVMNL